MNDPKQVLTRQPYEAWAKDCLVSELKRRQMPRLFDVPGPSVDAVIDTSAPAPPVVPISAEEIRLQTALENERILHMATKNEVVRLKQKLNEAYAAMNSTRDASGDFVRRIVHLQATIGELHGEIAHWKTKAKR